MKTLATPLHLPRRRLHRAVFGSVFALGAMAALPGHAAGPCLSNPEARKRPVLLAAACNPCAAKKGGCGACNPCAAKRAGNPCNPCAAKRACNPCNPCAAKRAASPCNPCAAKRACNPCNPCGGATVKASRFTRPCGAGVDPAQARALVAEGERLWKDAGIGRSGLSCDSCHKGGASLNASFAKAYPHRVAMPAQMAGVDEVHADEMVQFCMLVPMQAEPLAWTSRELAALTAYTVELQKSFNPCAAKKHPCNPCNPCAAKKVSACGPCNPCAAKKASPCSPCNPCAAKKRSG